MTTHADPEGRPTIFGKLPKDLPRLISVGRLDLNTEGLLLLTNDGGLARVLELPETGWLRRYRVRAHGAVTQPQLDALRKGVTVDGVRYGEIEATLDRHQGANIWLTFAIREGKNREVRNVLEHLGLRVNRLIRVSFGPFQLGESARGRRSRKSAPGICANSSANESRRRQAPISTGRSCSIAPPFMTTSKHQQSETSPRAITLKSVRSATARIHRSRSSPEIRTKMRKSGRTRLAAGRCAATSG